jgi:hypothetical protein
VSNLFRNVPFLLICCCRWGVRRSEALRRGLCAGTPLRHQLEERVKAHVLVVSLGYGLQVTLKHLLKRSGSEYSPSETLKRLAEIFAS